MAKAIESKAVVVFSGGQDSTTSLFWAMEKFGKKNIHPLTIDYGQRHRIEIEAARAITQIAGIYNHSFIHTDIFRSIGDSALVGSGDISRKHRAGKLPASFVPGRNILFLTIAAALAFKLGFKNLVTGVCQIDYSGYPDCRDYFIRSLQETLSAGMDYKISIHTPLMDLSKMGVVLMADSMKGCMEALGFSHTCYEGQYPPCGKCPACKLRAKGFKQAKRNDPLIERARSEGVL